MAVSVAIEALRNFNAIQSPEKTKEFYDKLRKENVITSLRENKIRVSPYVFNNERDLDRLISVVTV